MKYRLAALIAVFSLTIGLVAPLPASAANVFGDACSNAKVKTSAVCQDSGAKTNPLTGSNGLLIKITQIIAVVAGAAAVLIIIISGLRYVLANGDTAQAMNARNSILYAVVGLVVIAIAASIISFVVSKL